MREFISLPAVSNHAKEGRVRRVFPDPVRDLQRLVVQQDRPDLPLVKVEDQASLAAVDRDALVVSGRVAEGVQRAVRTAGEPHGHHHVDVHVLFHVVQKGAHLEGLEVRDPQRGRHQVTARVQKHAPAGQGRVEPPAAGPAPVLRDVGDDAAHLADGAFPDQFPGVDVRRHEIALVADQEYPACFLRFPDQRARMPGRDGERLLDEGVQITFQGVFDLLVVHGVGRTDHHRVEFAVPDHVPVVGVAGDLFSPFLHQRRGRRFRWIRDGGEVHPAVGLDARHVGAPHVASATDQGDAQTLFGHNVTRNGLDYDA